MGWQFFFWILAAVLAFGGLVMSLARTPPEDAISNLSLWVDWCGFHRIPPWLRDRQADDVAFRWARRVVAMAILAGVAGAAVWISSPSLVAPVPSSPSTRIYDEKLPGFGSGMVVKINDIIEDRKKYQYSFKTPEGSKAEFYLSPSNHFAFSVTDTHGEVYSLELPIGSGGVPFEQWAYIFCEVGTASSYSYLRAFVNGREVARRDYPFPLDLGSRRWLPTIGADSNNKNGGAFMFSEILALSMTLNDKELAALSENELSFYKLNEGTPK